MQPNQVPGFGGGLHLQAHDLRDPRRAMQAQPVYAQQSMLSTSQATAPVGNVQHGAGVVMAFAPQQPGVSIAISQPILTQHAPQQLITHQYASNSAAIQATNHAQHFAVPQQAVAAQPTTLQLQGLTPQQTLTQQPVWAGNFATAVPSHAVHASQPQSFGVQQLQLQPLQQQAPLNVANLNSNAPIHILGDTQTTRVPPQQQHQPQAQYEGILQHQQQQQPYPQPGSGSAQPFGQSPATGSNLTSVPTVPGINTIPALGGDIGNSSAATPTANSTGGAGGPRPMKRQANQTFAGPNAKRQQQVGSMNRNVSYRAPYTVAESPDELSMSASRALGAGPFPGVVQMLADVQAYIIKVMLYMVKHNQYRPSQHSGRVDKQGYDLCKLKADFLNEYKYEIDTRAAG